jgi:hypothetical protein
MSDAEQQELNASTKAGGQPSSAGATLPTFKVVPFTEPHTKDDLFGFRAEMAPTEPEREVEREEAKPKGLPVLLMAAIALALALMVVFAIPMLYKPKPPALYIDLGNRRFDAAGLSGRLIARWNGSAAYEFYIDPIDQHQVAGFQAVAQDPPYPLSFVLRLRDASGVVACEKEIVFPAPIVQSAGAVDPGQVLLPRKTADGDTVQNVAGSDGQISEMTVTGGLPCELKAYQSLTAWEFSTNFPNFAAQAEWLKHENSLAGNKKNHSGSGNPYGIYALVKSLPAPVDGDDVIVSDNPARGIVATSGGRVFLVGSSVLTNRALDWQSFPASVHFRCEKNAVCMITRLNSRTMVRAHLMK